MKESRFEAETIELINDSKLVNDNDWWACVFNAWIEFVKWSKVSI